MSEPNQQPKSISPADAEKLAFAAAAAGLPQEADLGRRADILEAANTDSGKAAILEELASPSAPLAPRSGRLPVFWLVGVAAALLMVFFLVPSRSRRAQALEVRGNPPEWYYPPPQNVLPPTIEVADAQDVRIDATPRDVPPNLRELADLILSVEPMRPLVPKESKKFQRAEIKYGANEIKIEEVNAFFTLRNLEQTYTFLDDAHLWPGQLIQGAGLRQSQINPISAPRAGIRFVFKDIRLPNAPNEDYSRPVDEANLANFNAAYHDFLKGMGFDPNGKPQIAVTPVDADYQIIEAFSTSDAEVKLGFQARGFGQSVKMSHEERRRETNSETFLCFRQVYFTVAVDPPQAKNGLGHSCVGFFANNASVENIRGQFGPDSDLAKQRAPLMETAPDRVSLDPWKDGNQNPPLYISQVSYGRMLIAAVSSQSKHSEVKQALSVALSYAGVNVDVDAQRKAEQLLSTATFRVNLRGGPTQGLANLTQLSGVAGLKAIQQWIKAGETLDASHLPKPIAFTARHLRDNTIATQYVASKYSLIDDYNVKPTLRVKVPYVRIQDDHDGGFRGDGDWLFFLRRQGENHDLLATSLEGGDESDHYPSWWSKEVALSGDQVVLHLRMGEEEHPRVWDAFPWDRGVEKMWNINPRTINWANTDFNKPIATETLRDGDGNYAQFEAYVTLPQELVDRLKKKAEDAQP